jgi:hypothetical protein
MAVLAVIFLWCVVSMMAALSLGRFFSVCGGDPAPMPVRQNSRATPRCAGLDEGRRRVG